MFKYHQILSLGAMGLVLLTTAACGSDYRESNVDQPAKRLEQKPATVFDEARCERVNPDPAAPSQVKVTNIGKEQFSNLFTYVEARLTSKDQKTSTSISFPVTAIVPPGGSVVSPQSVENWTYCKAGVVVSSHYPDGY